MIITYLLIKKLFKNNFWISYHLLLPNQIKKHDHQDSHQSTVVIIQINETDLQVDTAKAWAEEGGQWCTESSEMVPVHSTDDHDDDDDFDEYDDYDHDFVDDYKLSSFNIIILYLQV